MKVILYIALSLDGYIADASGGVGWLGGHNASYEGDNGYSEFIAGVSSVVMGYTTYHQIVTQLSPSEWPYAGLNTYVLTHRQIPDAGEITFINQPACELVAQLKQQVGKAVWICGGANVAQQLIEKDLVDEYHLAVIPTLLGSGIRLFGEHEKELQLKLVSSSSENGIVQCVYHRR